MARSRAALGALALSALAAAQQTLEMYGGVAGVPASDATALANGAALVAAFAAANRSTAGAGRTIVVNASYQFLPTAVITDIANVTLQLDGALLASSNTSAWTRDAGGSPLSMLAIERCAGFRLVGSGRIDGAGFPWWDAVMSGAPDRRPQLFDLGTCTDAELVGITLSNSPQYHLSAHDHLRLTITGVTVYVDLERQAALARAHGYLAPHDAARARVAMARDLAARAGRGAPSDADMAAAAAAADNITFPLNTDGLDVSGRTIRITNVSVTNYDDSVCIKPANGNAVYSNCSADIVVDGVNVVAGVGMSVGSVPPNDAVNCVDGVVFRNVVFNDALKGIYVKTNPGDTGSGRVNNVTYENIYINNTLWWAVWLGPQQQHQPGGSGTSCSFLYPLPGQDCPAQPRVPLSNIVLRNVTIAGGLLSPGVILCNSTAPCAGFVFEDVAVTDASGFPEPAGSFLCEYADITARNVTGATFLGNCSVTTSAR